MNSRRYITIITFLILSLSLASCGAGCKSTSEPMVIKYQDHSILLPEDITASAQLDSAQPEGEIAGSYRLKDGFILSFSMKLETADSNHVLVEIPQVLEVRSRISGAEDSRGQNYQAYPMEDGSIPVLEASLWLNDRNGKKRPLTTGIPLSLLNDPFGENTIYLQFTGTEWSLYVNGRLYDNDFAIGYPETDDLSFWKIDNSKVSHAELYMPALTASKGNERNRLDTVNIQFWTPPYHNAWVGDVVTLYHEGRYHIFYLFDRRGHGSKFNVGGHYFEHLSTTDFRNWTEHEAATAIENQWESHGTGTAFVYDGKMFLSYGLHTTRIYPSEQTTLPTQWDYLRKHGNSGFFDYDSLRFVPAGSTYAVSEDNGLHFKKSHKLIHHCENPSIYVTEDGTFRMLANYGARGTWASASLDGGWGCINADFPPGGDCTFPFRWNGYDYIIGGFNRLWYKKTEEREDQYKDMVKAGIDFYNGMSVPSISEISDNRFLMAAWIKTENWGGPLVIHELIQHPDGRIGSKWMEEIVPATGKPSVSVRSIDNDYSLDVPEDPFILTFEVVPEESGKGRIAVDFEDRDMKGQECEWQMQMENQRAQFAKSPTEGFASDQRTLGEGGDVSTARNYAISGVKVSDKPFTVRIFVNQSKKVRGTLLDVEIDGQRTMLSYRPSLFVDCLTFKTEGARIRKVTCSPLL